MQKRTKKTIKSIIIISIIVVSIPILFFAFRWNWHRSLRYSDNLGCFVMIKPSKGSGDIIDITQKEFIKEMKKQNLSKEELQQRVERERIW